MVSRYVGGTCRDVSPECRNSGIGGFFFLDGWFGDDQVKRQCRCPRQGDERGKVEKV